jgi:hypothetical protein
LLTKDKIEDGEDDWGKKKEDGVVKNWGGGEMG